MAESVRPGETYQTLDEQRERLSPAEERFERLRQATGLFLGPIVFLALYLLPLSLPQYQQALAAVFSFVIIYWLTEPIPIPVTAVLALALSILFGVSPADDVFGAFSSSTIFLFIGAFIITIATPAEWSPWSRPSRRSSAPPTVSCFPSQRPRTPSSTAPA